MATEETKLVYEFNDITTTTPVGDRTISIDSTTLNSGASLTDNTAYYIEMLLLTCNGSHTQSGARRVFFSYQKSGGALSVAAGSVSEDFMSTNYGEYTFGVSGNDMTIELSTAQVFAGQHTRVFINVKAYGV